jgi:hypothetical protein
MDIDSDRIKRTAHIDPFGRPDDALVPKAEHLTACDKIDPAFAGTPNLAKRFANVPNVLVGRIRWHMMVKKDPGVLSNADQLQPTRGLYIDSKAELSQIIGVIDRSMANAHLTLGAIAKLTAKLNPMRQMLVQLLPGTASHQDWARLPGGRDTPGVSGWNALAVGLADCRAAAGPIIIVPQTITLMNSQRRTGRVHATGRAEWGHEDSMELRFCPVGGNSPDP